MRTIWLLDLGEGDYESFSCIESAKNFAYKKLIEWGYDPKNRNDKEIFNELEKSYKNEEYSAFWIEGILWCYEINFHDN